MTLFKIADLPLLSVAIQQNTKQKKPNAAQLAGLIRKQTD